MGVQLGICNHLQNQFLIPPTLVSSLHKGNSYNGLLYWCGNGGRNHACNKQRKISGLGGSNGLDSFHGRIRKVGRKGGLGIVASASSNVASTFWDSWVPEKGSKAPSLSDIFWPSAG